jgi:hypothetical protein
VFLRRVALDPVRSPLDICTRSNLEIAIATLFSPLCCVFVMVASINSDLYIPFTLVMPPDEGRPSGEDQFPHHSSVLASNFDGSSKSS